MRLHLVRLRVPLVGALRLAATAHGLVAVRLDDDEEAFRRQLARRFPGATQRAGNGVTADAARAIRAYLAGGPQPAVAVVVPEQGFSARVWREVARIPYGQVRSYGRLARALRRPLAARAVGQACGLNPLPLVVPCHRVIASDGSLGGYTAGVALKRALLVLEGRAVGGP